MRCLYLLIPFLHLSTGVLPREFIILSRGLVYPKPQFEKTELLRDLCEQKRNAFFDPFRGNLTKREIKDSLREWADSMVAEGHNGTDVSIGDLIDQWDDWRKQAEGKVFSLLREAKEVYREIVSNSSHCTGNLSLCQDRLDLLPSRTLQVLSFLSSGGNQFCRGPPSNHSFTLPPPLNLTLPPHLNWMEPHGNGSFPQWNSSIPTGNHSLPSFDENSSEETELIDDIKKEEGFSFGNLGVYEDWFHYWMNGLMNPSKWNTTRDAILQSKNGNNSILPRFPTGLMASVALPNESNWTLSVLDALERGIEGASRVGLEVAAPVEVAAAVSDLTRLFSTITDSFKGNLVEGYNSPQLRSPPNQPAKNENSIPSTAILPVDWSSIQKRLTGDSSDLSPEWKEEAQSMYQSMANLGFTEEIMEYLESLHSASKSNKSVEFPRSKRSPPMDLPESASGSRVDLIFGNSPNSIQTPSTSSPSSLSSMLSKASALIGDKMSELESLGLGLISQVVDALTGRNSTAVPSISPSTISSLLNSTVITNLTSGAGNQMEVLSNASSLAHNSSLTATNISSLPDFSSVLSGLFTGSTGMDALSPSNSSFSTTKDLSLVSIISSIFDNMEEVTSPPLGGSIPATGIPGRDESTEVSEKSTSILIRVSTPPPSSSAFLPSISSHPPSLPPSSSSPPSPSSLPPSSPPIPTPSSLPPPILPSSPPPLLSSSTVPSSHSSIPPSSPPTIAPTPIPSTSSPLPSPSPSSLRPSSVLPLNPPDLRDILKGNGFNVPDIKNLSSVVEAIDRLNELLSNQTRSMMEAITRTIEDAFKVGGTKEGIVQSLNATIEEAKEIVKNGSESRGDHAVSSLSWSEIKNHLFMSPNVSRDDYEYKEYEYEEMEEERPTQGNSPDGGNESGEEEDSMEEDWEMGEEVNGTVLIPYLNETAIEEGDERVVKGTLLFYDKMNCTLSTLFSIIGNESLSIVETKRALNAVYWNTTLLERKMISYLIRNAEIPSMVVEEGVRLRGPCNGTEESSISRRRERDEASLLLLA